MVGSCRSVLVPIRISTEPGGGSSSVLRKQLADSSLRSSASSMTTTLPRPRADLSEKSGTTRASARSGILPFSGGRAAVRKSGWVPASTWTQDGQRSQPPVGRPRAAPRTAAPWPVRRRTAVCRRRAGRRRGRRGPAGRGAPPGANASTRASCPRMRCQDTAPPPARTSACDAASTDRACVHDANAIRPRSASARKPCAHRAHDRPRRGSRCGRPAAPRARPPAPAAGRARGQVRLQAAGGEQADLPQLLRVQAARVALVDDVGEQKRSDNDDLAARPARAG